MALKPGTLLQQLSPEIAGAVFTHPANRANIASIVELVTWLRSCNTPDEYNEFQRILFQRLYQAEEARAQRSRIVKRLRSGRSLPPDHPAPPGGVDPLLLENWLLETFVYERLVRQLRVVGDGLAWRSFGFDRRIIHALSRNTSPGMMYGKAGLGYELGRIADLWAEHRHFALLHDLTNCLRIADLTEFADDGTWLREIKKAPRSRREQRQRAQAAVDAIMNGGPLPGSGTTARLVEVDEAYVTDIDQLRDLIQLANDRGCASRHLTSGRAVIVTSVLAASHRWPKDSDEGLRVIASLRQQAIEAAGIAGDSHHVIGTSGDTASRISVTAPWSIYPLTPADCAGLICDSLVFETVISVQVLQSALANVGFYSEVVLPPTGGDLNSSHDVLRLRWNDRIMTVHQPSLNQLLYELVQPDTWARGIRKVIGMPSPPPEPVLVFAGESDVWRLAS